MKNQLLEDIDLNAKPIDLRVDVHVFIEPKISKKILRDNAQKQAMLYVQSLGIDLEKYVSYMFGKGAAFALCYGATQESAILNARKSSLNIDWMTLATSSKLLKLLLKDGSHYNRFNGMLTHLHDGRLEEARKIAVDDWKKNLAANITCDSEILKKLVENGCINPRGSVKIDSSELGVNAINDWIKSIIDSDSFKSLN